MSTAKGIWIAIGSFLVVVAVALLFYFLVFATATTRGKVALHNAVRTPSQLQFSYEYFHDTCHSILAETQQLTTLQTQYNTEIKQPTGSDPFGQRQSRLDQLQGDITGLSNVRDSNAQEYNAKSNEYTHNFMKSNNLPAEIGPPTGTPYDQLVCEGAQQ